MISIKTKILNKKLFFFLIISIAIFLRFYNLSSVPPSASLDEASIGYNAYSILETGKDEYGNKFPILLRAYDDWRPALYVYLVIPFVKILGLNVLAVRLPSVILSILTIIATYFLVKQLFVNRGTAQKNQENNAEKIALVASFLFAINPWHIYISRLGHEANAGLAFYIFAFIFFLRKNIIFSFIFFALSFASYQAEKIFIPLFIIVLLIFFRREILFLRKKVLFAFIIVLIVLFPFIKETLSPNALIRLSATNVFNSNQDLFYKEAVILQDSVKKNDLMGKIVHNRRTVALKIFFEGYISHFNPFWLFENPSNDRFKAPGFGLMYIWELPLIVLGLFVLIKQKLDKRIKYIIITWILLSPLPGAITTDYPHAMRSYTFLPTWQILSALGFIQIYSLFKSEKARKNILLLTSVVIAISIFYFYKQYFYAFPKTQSSSFQYALSEAIPLVLNNEKSYGKVVFSNKDNLYQSYMFFLFYSKYNPVLYQKEGGTKSGGFSKNHQFGKYEFRSIDWQTEEKGILYIGNPTEFTSSVISRKYINNLDETLAIEINEK